ncbi:MAG: calcium-binding protein [Bauldia litoralis]
MAKLTGNKKANKLKGTNHDDKIFGLGGHDLLTGRGGKDKLIGGDGNDILDGGKGADTYNGGAGNDLMHTRDDAVADKFFGGAGIDTVSYAKSKIGAVVDLLLNTGSGAAQADRFYFIENIDGTAHADQLTGDAGANRLRGLGGDDKLFGGLGNDTLDGGDGNDFMEGGAGADTFIGGAGVDTVSYIREKSGVTVYLAGGSSSGAAAGDKFQGVENVEGTAYSDYIHGDGAANKLSGLGGKDYLFGGAGNDRLEGGDGNDLMEGGSGADAFFGGAGIDMVSYSHEKSGVNVYLFGAPNGGAAAGDTFNGIENIEGSIYSDVIQGDGQVNALYGLSGADVINGGGGNDILDGGDGADILDGGAGNDRIYAADDTNFSPDIIVGGSGNDTVDYFGSMGGVHVDLTANTASGAAIGDTFTAVENVNGYYYDDTLRPGANGHAFGDRGNDVLYDSTGTEVLRGGRGTDILSDNKFGEDGLRDIFVLENGFGSDVVFGFNSGDTANSDRFWLPEDMFAGLNHNAAGVLSLGYFVNKDSDHNATAAHAQLIYQGDTHAIWYDEDGTGGGAAVQIATLVLGPDKLKSSDFLMVDI